MGGAIKRNPKRARKKVKKLCKFVSQFRKNKEFATFKDEKEKQFLQSMGVVFLEDEWEMRVATMFFYSLQKESLNFEFIRCYCDKFELDIVEIWTVLNRLFNELNKNLFKG